MGWALIIAGAAAAFAAIWYFGFRRNVSAAEPPGPGGSDPMGSEPGLEKAKTSAGLTSILAGLSGAGAAATCNAVTGGQGGAACKIAGQVQSAVVRNVYVPAVKTTAKIASTTAKTAASVAKKLKFW